VCAVRHQTAARVAGGPAPATRPARHPLVALSDVLNHATEACYVALTIAFASVMFVGVVFRYVLNDSLSWSDELATMLFVWATFLSIAAGYCHGKHVNLDLVVRALPPYWRSRVDVLAEGLAAGYLISLLVSSLVGVPFVARGHSAALQWPLTVPFLAIPVACGLMLVHWAGRNIVGTSRIDAVVKSLIALGFFVVVYLPLGQYVELVGAPRFYLLVAVFFLPLLIGVPVAFAMGLVATTYLAVFGNIPFHEGARQISYGIELLPLLAIPLLVLAGLLMHAIGVAGHLVQFAQVLVGRVRGGLGASNVVASLLFGDISGSPVSDTAAIGSLMIPQMKRRGYAADFCAALQGASGTLALLAPFSVTLILYATAVSVSVGRLAIATVVPAFLLALSFMLVVIFHARRHGYPREPVPRSLVLPSIARALPGLLAIVLIVGGVLGGVFSPAEVGAILVAYVMFLSVVLYRTTQSKSLYRATIEAGYISGMTLFMIATSAFLAFVLARDLVGFRIVEAVSELTTDRLAVILLVNLVFVILGMVLEAAPMIFGFLPSFMPLLQHVGVDPVHFGILFAINMGLGMLIPPVALNLFVSSAIADVPYHQAVRASLPFIAIMAVDWILVAVFPEISLLLPHLIFAHAIR
jgi:tripartite ATP-independent transporter DctM subunit